jgi:hypothetical protein
MDREEILSAIDSEIERLQQARAAITSLSAPQSMGGSSSSFSVPASAPKKRTISAAGRKRIAETQRRRWAAQKSSAQKAPAKRIATRKQQKATKEPTKEVAVTRIPIKKQRQRKPRGPKNAIAGNALSHQSGVVAVPKNAAGS